MNPGGVTETIWYFAGYLHLTEELARAGELYERPAIIKTPDGDGSVPSPADSWSIEELESNPIRSVRAPDDQDAFFSPDLDAEFAFSLARLARDFVGKGPIFPVEALPKLLPAASYPKVLLDVPLTYGSGDHLLADIRQWNLMNDDDVLGDPNTGVTELHQFDVAETLYTLLEAAWAEIPEELAVPHAGTAGLIDFIGTRNAAAADGEPAEVSIEPGHYQNGVLVPEDPTPDGPVPKPELPAVLTGFGDINSGLEAELGGNVAFNAAVIADLNELSTSMVVMGDYFESNAIVQTNVYRDNDQVEVGGESAAVEAITGENVADNIAHFISTELDVEGWGHSLKWNVDMVDGDLLDVKSLKQTNWLSDNDTTVQTTSSSYSLVTAGASGQYNVINFVHDGKYYDLIIVAGDYHKANWIFQTNILLDDDIVKVATDRDDTISQTISTGQNVLTNEATIENIGGHNFKPITDDVSKLVNAVASDTVDAPTAWHMPASGRVFDILYIKGDYYDINVVWQVNIIADVDTAIQFLPGWNPGHDKNYDNDHDKDSACTHEGDSTPNHGKVSKHSHEEETTSEQHVSTGGNLVKNLAAIVDTGPVSDFQYLGGDHYEEVVLVQTNIIEDNDHKVIYGDTSKLVSEVIAFTGQDWDEEPEASTPVKDPMHYDDLMGNLIT